MLPTDKKSLSSLKHPVKNGGRRKRLLSPSSRSRASKASVRVSVLTAFGRGGGRERRGVERAVFSYSPPPPAFKLTNASPSVTARKTKEGRDRGRRRRRKEMYFVSLPSLILLPSRCVAYNIHCEAVTVAPPPPRLGRGMEEGAGTLEWRQNVTRSLERKICLKFEKSVFTAL